MFTQSPATAEFFDIESFINDNMTALRQLHEDACRIVDNDAELLMDRETSLGVAMACAAMHDMSSIEGDKLPAVDFTSDRFTELAYHLTIMAAYFQLEQDGCVEFVDGQGFRVTEKGRMLVEQMRREGESDGQDDE